MDGWNHASSISAKSPIIESRNNTTILERNKSGLTNRNMQGILKLMRIRGGCTQRLCGKRRIIIFYYEPSPKEKLQRWKLLSIINAKISIKTKEK
jgi:hypothetical protein